MFKKLLQKAKMFLCGVLAVAMCFTGFAVFAPNIAYADTVTNTTKNSGLRDYTTGNNYSPIVKKVDGTWWYYVNNQKDTSYNGLASNENGTWWIENGKVTFNFNETHNWTNGSSNGAGGWKVSGSEVVNGSHMDSNSYFADDNNGFSGRLIVGDSRNVQMYQYNNFANYDKASFVATWGGQYNESASTTITGNNKKWTMYAYIDQTLRSLGYCDVYLFASINDTNHGDTSRLTSGPNWEIQAAEFLSDIGCTFNGETVYPTIHIIGLINRASSASYAVSSSYLSQWNQTLKDACDKHSNWDYNDWSSCVHGYTDGTHYDDTTLKNLWNKVLSCPHEYKTYTKEATCTSAGRTSDICIKCGNVKSTSEIAKKAHNYNSGVVTTAATCTTEGVKTYTCSTCGATKTESIAKTGHSYDSGKVTTAPTYTQEGVKTYTCTVCGATKTETIDKLEPEFSVTLTTDQSSRHTYNVGDYVYFTAEITQTNTDEMKQANSSIDEITNVVIEDVLPGYFVLADDPITTGVSGATDTATSGQFKINIPSMKYGETATVTFEAVLTDISAGESVDNTIYVSADGSTEKQSATKTISVASPSAAMSIRMETDQSSYDVGDTVSYTLTVSQTERGATANNVVVTDTLPDNLELTDVTSVSGTITKSGNSFTATNDSMSYYGSWTIRVTAKAKKAGSDITNTATVSSDNTKSKSGSATISIDSLDPSLTISNSTVSSTVNTGSNVRYTITVRQVNTKSTANNVVITDEIPDNITVTNVTTDKGILSWTNGSNNITVTCDSLGSDESIIVDIYGTVDSYPSVGYIDNTAYVSADGIDTISSTRRITPWVDQCSAKVETDKNTYNVGDKITYKVTIYDVTTSIENLHIHEALPSNVTLESVDSITNNGYDLMSDPSCYSLATTDSTIDISVYDQTDPNNTFELVYTCIANEGGYDSTDHVTVECNGGSFNLYAPIDIIDNSRECSHTNYTTSTTTPTCIAEGYTTYTCSDCGYIWTGNKTNALDHDYTETVVDASCEGDGYTRYVCSRCGDEYTDNMIPAYGHMWDNGSVTTKATCTNDGVKTYTCSDCGATKTETIAASGHAYDEGKVTEEPTCTEEGVMTYTCANCGKIMTESIDALGHFYDEEVVVESTCTDAGYTEHTCIRCGDTYKESKTAALGHAYNTTVVEPTCTEGGYTIFECGTCLETYKGDYTDPTGHTWDEGTIISNEIGHDLVETVYTCTNCGEQYSTYEDADGQEWTVEVTPAYCDESGLTTYTCLATGETYKGDYTMPTGHDYMDVVIDPTCTEGGYTEHICYACDEVYYDDETDALGHTWDDGVVTKEATENEDGEITYTCEACGDTEIVTFALDAQDAAVPADDEDSSDSTGSTDNTGSSSDSSGSTGSTGSSNSSSSSESTGSTGSTSSTGTSSSSSGNTDISSSTGDTSNSSSTSSTSSTNSSDTNGTTNTANSSVNKESLADEVSTAQDLLSGISKDSYTEESYKALEDAIAAAQEVLSDENATQSEVDAALEALDEAQANLTKLDDGTSSSSDTGNSTSETDSSDNGTGDGSVSGNASDTGTGTGTSGSSSSSQSTSAAKTNDIPIGFFIALECTGVALFVVAIRSRRRIR